MASSNLSRLLAFSSLLLAPVALRAQTLRAPTSILASDAAYGNKVAVTWTAVPRATTYRVFRSASADSGTAVSIGTTASWIFEDTTATPGDTFTYWVRAESASLGVSPLSAPDTGSVARATARPAQPPVPPPLQPPPAPAGNPVTAAKVALGKTLFWDEQLSSNNTLACATCHAPEKGGSDLRATLGSTRSRNNGPDALANTADDVTGSPGIVAQTLDGVYTWDTARGFAEQTTSRYPRSVTDAAYTPELFWDGRASGTFTDPLSSTAALAAGAALESQVLGPPLNAGEMAHLGRNWADLTTKLITARPLALAADLPAGLAAFIDGRTYPELFDDAFGSSEITPVRLAEAIASYERTLYSDRTPVDLAVAQIAPLSASAAAGRGVFNASRCDVCHAGPLHSDNSYRYIGLRPTAAPEDAGRFTVTGNPADRGRFRVPSLRNVALRGPFMHTGSLATLADVVNFYDRGGDFNAPNKDPNIRPLNLTPQQKADLIAYLQSLTDPRVATAAAPFDHPSLAAASSRAPQLSGTGLAGAGGQTPLALAVEPALAGSRVTTALSNALGGAPAVLAISTAPLPATRIPSAAEVIHRAALTLDGTGPGNGHTSYPWNVPATATVGDRYYARWYVQDSSAPNGVATSASIELPVIASVLPSTATDVRIVGLSTRAQTGGAAGTAIAGFVIAGTGTKQLVVRAVGPTLATLGVSQALADPSFSLVRDSAAIASNDNWLATDATTFSRVGTFPLPAGSKDAAIVVDLTPGNVTAPVHAPAGTMGNVLLEGFDADEGGSAPTARLAGVSARAHVGTGDDILIAGIVVTGSGSVKLLIRAVGPGLTAYGVTDVLADPQLTLNRGGTSLVSNDDWSAHPLAAEIVSAAATVGDFALTPGSKDAALLVTLPAGIYTALVQGAGNTTGTALVEVYVVP